MANYRRTSQLHIFGILKKDFFINYLMYIDISILCRVTPVFTLTYACLCPGNHLLSLNLLLHAAIFMLIPLDLTKHG